MKKKSTFPFHFLLFAIFPVLSLLGHNIQEVSISIGVRPMLVMIGGAACVWIVISLATKSFQKGAILTTWLVLLFYVYGRVYVTFTAAENILRFLGHHRYLLPCWVALAVIGAYLILRIFKETNNLTLILNYFSVFLLIVPVYQINNFEIRSKNIENQVLKSGIVTASEGVRFQPEGLPDVYIIILDAHLRSDVLKETFNLDNSEFIESLTEMGFYIAPCGMSNYAYTPLSVVSFLNMQYIQDMSDEFSPPNTDLNPLFELIKHNEVRSNLESLGYSTYSLASYQRAGWDDATHYFPLDSTSLLAGEDRMVLNKFERILFDTTLLRILTDYNRGATTTDKIPLNYPYADHVRQQWSILSGLEDVSSDRGPKLVWAHLTMPHAPYVFYPDGSLIPNPPELPWVTPLTWDQYLQYYSWGVQYTDKAILPVLDAIIENSETPPIIILTGDHGADSANRLSILSAFYVPDEVKAKIPPNISMVNYFRFIFNEIFGANYELLEDKSYLSDRVSTFSFAQYPETMPACIP